MSAARKRQSRRYSREQNQEDRSEAQFRERLAEVQWPCDRLGRDLGEDLLVRIYDGGASTGLTFHVQLKSVATLEMIKRTKRSPFPPDRLAYRLDVKDLLHWEVSAVLVVLVVWDVEDRTGWWRPIPEIIKELDKEHKGWRDQGTVVVTVSMENGTNDEGLQRLRWAVADHDLPVVPKPKTGELTLRFHDAHEKAAALAAFERAIDRDDVVEFFVPEVQHPEWHRRIYGDLKGPGHLRISRTTASRIVPVRVDFESSDGMASLPYVELRSTRRGAHEVVLSNEQQGLPAELRIEMGDDHFGIKLRLAHLGRDVYEAQEAASVALVMAQTEVRVRVTALTAERPTFAVLIDDPPDDSTLSRLTEWRAFVDKLAFIQRRLSSQRILIPEGGIPREDVMAVERVFAIVSTGVESGNISLSCTIGGEDRLTMLRDLHDRQMVISIGEGEGEPIRLLNAVFEPGAGRVMLADPVEFFAEYDRRNRVSHGASNENLVEFDNIPVLYEYPKWIPEEARWDRLVQMAMSQDGYVVLSQARWVGYSDDVFLALIPEHRIEPVVPDVFHLTHFPRSEHENLIALWLQTDRKGVFSHETALFLHDLSDVLPARRNITVPRGWSPGERRLDPDVVLHHGEIGEDELSWIGPVPYTAPIRTLRDCVEVSVSPDLIEQTVAAGLRRGLFTEADLPPGLRARAA